MAIESIGATPEPQDSRAKKQVEVPNKFNNTIWAEFTDNNNIVDENDVIYKPGTKPSSEISNFLKEHSGENWSDSLKARFNMLLSQFNAKKDMEKSQNNALDEMKKITINSDFKDSYDDFVKKSQSDYDSFLNNTKNDINSNNTPQIATASYAEEVPTGNYDPVYNAMIRGEEFKGGENITLNNGTILLKVNENNKTYYYKLNNEGKPTLPALNDSEVKVLTQNQQENRSSRNKEVDTNIRNLKPGESYKTIEIETKRWGTGASEERREVTYTRNQDGTLTSSYKESLGRGKFVSLETHYNSDRTAVISQQRVAKYGVSTMFYDEKKRVTDFSNYNQEVMPTSKGLHIAQELRKSEAAQCTITDSSDQVIVRYTNGEFINAKGKTIDMDKAIELMDKSGANVLIENF